MTASNTEPAQKKPHGKARHAARSQARLAAVQALYQMDLSGIDIGDVIAQFRAVRLGLDAEGKPGEPADADFFEDLVRGVVGDQARLDPAINAALASGWTLPRLDTTLRAILRAGAYEIYGRSDVPPRTVIDEYVNVAHAFFDGDEPKVVNAVLDRLARELLGGV